MKQFKWRFPGFSANMTSKSEASIMFGSVPLCFPHRTVKELGEDRGILFKFLKCLFLGKPLDSAESTGVETSHQKKNSHLEERCILFCLIPLWPWSSQLHLYLKEKHCTCGGAIHGGKSREHCQMLKSNCKPGKPRSDNQGLDCQDPKAAAWLHWPAPLLLWGVLTAITPHLSTQPLANQTDVITGEAAQQQMVGMELTDPWWAKSSMHSPAPPADTLAPTRGSVAWQESKTLAQDGAGGVPVIP